LFSQWLAEEGKNPKAKSEEGRDEEDIFFWQAVTNHITCSKLFWEVTEYCYSETEVRSKGHHQRNSLQRDYQVKKRETKFCSTELAFMALF